MLSFLNSRIVRLPNPFKELTDLQWTYCQGVACGLSNEEIGSLYNVSYQAIERTLSKIYEKLAFYFPGENKRVSLATLVYYYASLRDKTILDSKSKRV